MKLSLQQVKVIRLMQEGWELGSDVYQIGRTVLIEKGRLQKYGLGHGNPCEECRITTINTLVRKGLIERLHNKYPMVEPTRYKLTEKGRNIKIG